MFGCAPRSSTPPVASSEAPEPEKRPGIRLPLSEYVPAPGLRALIALRPRQLISDEALRRDWAPLLGAERLRAYSAASGVDPALIEEAWISLHDLGTVFLWEGSRVGEAVEAAFRKRALTARDVNTDVSDLRFVTGMVDQKPHALVHLQGHFVAVVEGDVSLARLVSLRAQGRLTKTPSALDARALESHRDFHSEAPVRVFFVGPFPHATDLVIQGAADGVAAVSFLEGDLEVRARARGAWPALDDLDERLELWASQILDTFEMRALGWSQPHEPVDIDCEPVNPDEDSALRTCLATGSWNASRVARSLYRIVAAPSEELLDDRQPADKSTSPAGSESEAP